ncbi:unnamed protein product [Notodromas monacha]|uniref:[histone H4]-lysine(20) N-methyltransferase n=1 Tax=Notodromas monacha TaxID=399045 RepID=A0A7R9GC54_9CRUS|nr:unnamed protein product [Notodromas monacha]CAG0915622.1 unnamed protein product [Notodromas monacha]
MAPAGRRRRRPVPTLKATARVMTDAAPESPDFPSCTTPDVLDKPSFVIILEDDDRSKDSSHDVIPVSDHLPPCPTVEAVAAALCTTPTKARRDGVDSEGSPPKIRTRASGSVRKITEFYKPAPGGDDVGGGGDGGADSTENRLPSEVVASSPSRDAEGKENVDSPAVVFASPKSAVRELNWEQQETDPKPTPPHRIQSPLKLEAVAQVRVPVMRVPANALTKLVISRTEVTEAEKKPMGRPKKVTAVKQGAVAKQPTLEDFFPPVRRSSRKTQAAIAKETHWQIIQALRSGTDDSLEKRIFPGKGRGVVAVRNFAKGEFVVEYSGDLIDIKQAEQREAQYARDKNAGCYMYYFEHQNRQYCVDATQESGRLGRLINHSKSQANLSTKTIMVDGKPRLALFATRDIGKSEELLYDYGDRSKESLANHPWLAF